MLPILVCLSGLGISMAQELTPPTPRPDLWPDSAGNDAPKSPEPSAQGGPGGMGGLGGLGGGSQGPGYSATWMPVRPIGNGPGELGFVRQSLNLGMPIWLDGPDKLFASVQVQNVLFQGNPGFPQSGQSFPDQLWDVRIGGGYFHDLGDRSSWGVFLNAGSAGDRPFHHSRDLNVNAIGFYRIPNGERNAWSFSVFYSPLGQVAFPIPGVSYFWNHSDDFQMNVGIPFSLMWKPDADWRFDLSYLPVTNVRSRITYSPTTDVDIYGSWEWTNDTYFLADRVEHKERFFIDEKRLEIGTNLRPFGKWQINLAGGYAFDREFFRSRDGFFDRDGAVLRVENGLYLSMRLSLRF